MVGHWLALLTCIFIGGCGGELITAVPSLPTADDVLLEEISHAAFLFFWNEADPESGLVPDKTGVDVCSVASMGFGFAALPIGVERGWVTREEAEERAIRALRTLDASDARHEGIFCHFIILETGEATAVGTESGASTIDTALLAAGAIVAGEYFGGEVGEITDRLIAAMNWRAFINPENGQVHMAWEPGTPGVMDGPGQFTTQTWDWYSDETLLIAILGIAAPEDDHRLDPGTMTNWVRESGRLGDLEYIYSWPGTLFCHMWANAYIDFRRVGPDPGGVDWFFNTAMAVRANRDWCRAHANEFSTYGQDRWGITACSGPGDSYVVPGHQPRGDAGDNPAGGVVAPYGAGMSVSFAPSDAIAALRHMRALVIDGQPVWRDPAAGGYGLADAFCIDQGWVSEETFGIAHGPMLLMIENARSGFIWDLFMANDEIREGLTRAGFGEPIDWPAVDSEDEVYLRDLTAATWDCIAHFVAPETGLPYDTSEGSEFSSATNLGYYAACCAVAAEMGLIDHAEAVERVRCVLDAYEQFTQWSGFSQCWNSVTTLEPAPHDRMVSILDTGNMVSGFAVAAQALPEVAEQVDRILDAMDWSAIYDANAGLLFGGYDMGRGRLDPGWHVGDYAGDGRMAHFWAVAVGAASPESWANLGRREEEHFGMSFYQPGWMGGGLFMQVQDGLFLDETSTPAGRSAANFAYAQMLYAEMLGLDAWGWSACFSPDHRYLGWGGLEVPVITPHAAGMASMYYPHRAAECLRQLEAMGARVSWEEAGEALDFGFRDSIDLRTGEVSDLFLPNLDQAMMFLAMANALEDGLVHRLFESHPTVQRGMALIDEYTWPADQGWLAELRRRDTEPLTLPPSSEGTGPAPILIDDFEADDVTTNRLGGANTTWTRDATDPTVTLSSSHGDSDVGGCLVVDYDVESENPAWCGATFDLAGVDASGCDALLLRVMGTPDNIKVELHGNGGIGVARLSGIAEDEWRRIEIPFVDLGGMITDWSSLTQLILVFEDGASDPKVGTLRIDEIELVEQ